jgi:nucleotide-binding universal stress UspA family protein
MDGNCPFLWRKVVIIGGYGHSHLREIGFGGFTRSVLKPLTLPLL